MDRPQGTIWGFHPARARSPLDRDAILVIAPDAETCRALAQRLADVGYAVEWTTDARIVPAWVIVRRYALLVADHDSAADIIAVDPGLPVLPISDCMADDGVDRVGTTVRGRATAA